MTYSIVFDSMGPGECPHNSWRVELSKDDNLIMCIDYHSQGEPVVNDVLYCLVMDSDCLNYDNFEDWADSAGYNTDSRAAEKIYNACCKQTREFVSKLEPGELAKLREQFQDY